MNEDHEKTEKTDANNEKTTGFDRSRDMKKPYEAPSMTKLGDVAALTNVSVNT